MTSGKIVSPLAGQRQVGVYGEDSAVSAEAQADAGTLFGAISGHADASSRLRAPKSNTLLRAALISVPCSNAAGA